MNRILFLVLIATLLAGCAAVAIGDGDDATDLRPQNLFEFSHYKLIAATHVFAEDFSSVTRRKSLDGSSEAQIREFFEIWILGGERSIHKFQSSLSPTIKKLKLELTDAGKGTLQVSPEGVLRIDLVVLQAIVEEIARKIFGNLDGYRRLLQRAKRNDPALVREFNMSYTPEELATFGADRLPPGFAPFQLDQDLAGAFHYMVAHEAAHLQFGHFDRLRNASPQEACATMRALEFEADDAATRDTLALMNHPAFSFARSLLPIDVFGGLRGFHLAFREIKELHTGQGASGCSYPGIKERLARAAQIYSEKLARKVDVVIDPVTGEVSGIEVAPAPATETQKADPATERRLAVVARSGMNCLAAAEQALPKDVTSLTEKAGIRQHLGHIDAPNVREGLARFSRDLRACLLKAGAHRGPDKSIAGAFVESWNMPGGKLVCFFHTTPEVIGGTTLSVRTLCREP